jgi:geranylgeranyl diphosphate synthase type 3
VAKYNKFLYPSGILKQRPVDENIKKYAVSLMQATKSFDYTRQYLLSVEKQISDVIKGFGGNSFLEQIMHLLSKAYHVESPPLI